MHTPSRPATHAALAAVLLAIGLTALAGPVLAKEDVQARLDAPVARDTPGGSTLLVGMTVSVPGATGWLPLTGSPVLLRLYSATGATTWALGTETTPGHYVMHIVVPAGGVAELQVAMHGTSDLPIGVMGTDLVVGGISPSTAQLAPSTAAIAPGAAAEPSAAPAPAPLAGILLVVAVGLLGLLAALSIIRRSRGPGRLAGSRPMHGG
jgi:hypothetical protein